MVWERKEKSTNRITPILESDLRFYLRTSYRDINKIVALMRVHPGDWQYGGRFFDYRYTTENIIQTGRGAHNDNALQRQSTGVSDR